MIVEFYILNELGEGHGRSKYEQLTELHSRLVSLLLLADPRLVGGAGVVIPLPHPRRVLQDLPAVLVPAVAVGLPGLPVPAEQRILMHQSALDQRSNLIPVTSKTCGSR